MRRVLAGIGLGLAAASAAAGVQSVDGEAAQRLNRIIPKERIVDADCLECHGVKGYAIPIGAEGARTTRPLFVDAGALRDSVHGGLHCLACHADIDQLPHAKENLAAVDCVSCHEAAAPATWSPSAQAKWLRPEPPRLAAYTRDYRHSIHADTAVAGNARCETCHTAHYVFPSEDPRASTYRLNSPAMCGQCHTDALDAYGGSAHGAALRTPWTGDSATCSDCHSSHRIGDMEKLPAHRLVTENCGGCHEEAVKGYMASTHGQLAWHGDENVPKCVDCHKGHDLHAVADPASPMSEQRKLQTCRQCHEGANASFLQYHPHGTTENFAKYPLLWLLGKGMAVLIIAVLIFFYSHSMLWFYREKKSRPITWRREASRAYPVRIKPEKHRSGIHFRRFDWPWRLNHWALALSVMILVFTGMTRMYADTAWASGGVALLGGPVALGLVHRIAGIVFLAAIVSHAAVVLRRVLNAEHFDWFGPDSLLPRRKDWEDMKAQFRWFFGKGQPPRFDRWTYWEKFDYWAVYWGAAVIGISGLVLWFSEPIGQWLPGWVFNLAAIAHGLEAFLAVMTLFVVHFFNNHFRPSKFPLDTVMFTGSWDLEELKEERPAHYERLTATGALDGSLVPPPSARANLISHVLGFTLLGVGLILLVLVVHGFFARAFG